MDVGDGDGEDARRQHALHEAPGDQLPRLADVAASAVATASDHADPTMTRAADTSASRPTNGAASATATVGAVTVRLTAKWRRVEDAHQQRQQRLRRVEIEKGGEAGEDDRPDRRREH